jgi:hypothetical protein
VQEPMSDEWMTSPYAPQETSTDDDLAFDEEWGGTPEPEEQPEPVDDQPKKRREYRPQSFGEWVMMRFFGKDIAAELEERLGNLTYAIERSPETASNYLLRGEIHFKLREWAFAEDDLNKAVDLAENELQEASWGLIPQSTRDRALVLLRQLAHIRR